MLRIGSFRNFKKISRQVNFFLIIDFRFFINHNLDRLLLY